MARPVTSLNLFVHSAAVSPHSALWALWRQRCCECVPCGTIGVASRTCTNLSALWHQCGVVCLVAPYADVMPRRPDFVLNLSSLSGQVFLPCVLALPRLVGSSPSHLTPVRPAGVCCLTSPLFVLYAGPRTPRGLSSVSFSVYLSVKRTFWPFVCFQLRKPLVPVFFQGWL